MSLRIEVNHELEYMLNTIVEEEKSYEDLAAATTTPAYSSAGIVEEEKCCKDCGVMTTTSAYSTVGGDNGNKQGLLDCLQEYGVQDMSATTHIATETTDAEKDRVTVMETGEVEKYDECTASAQRDIVIKDTDKGFMRAMASAQQRRLLKVQHPSTGSIGPAWSPGRALQPGDAPIDIACESI
jgi:hypothetical protein